MKNFSFRFEIKNMNKVGVHEDKYFLFQKGINAEVIRYESFGKEDKAPFLVRVYNTISNEFEEEYFSLDELRIMMGMDKFNIFFELVNPML